MVKLARCPQITLAPLVHLQTGYVTSANLAERTPVMHIGLCRGLKWKKLDEVDSNDT
jgi:hypothetical protein